MALRWSFINVSDEKCLLSLHSFFPDWCGRDCGYSSHFLFPCCPRQRTVNLPVFWGIHDLCNHHLDRWPDGFLLRPLHVGETFAMPSSWAATGILMNIICTSFDKWCSTQLSALEFLPWILTSFFHSVPPAYLYYRFMTVSGDTYPHYERSLRPDLTCWNWIVGSIIWTFILTPQIVVLAAAVRVRRFDQNTAEQHCSVLS